MKTLLLPRANQPRPRTAPGFTLIELLLVLAVLVVLAAAALPMLTSEIDERARTKEEEYLKGMAAAVESYALRSRFIPDHTGFAAVIGPEMGTTPSRLLLNDRNLPRRILLDDRLRIGTNSSSVLPYRQTVKGSIKPVSPRLLLVSSLGEELPTSLTNGVLATNLFDAIWSTAPNQIPAGWSWTGKGADLKIQRIQLSDLFVELALNAQGVPYGSFSVDNVSTNVVSGSPRSLWVLKSTRLALNAPDGSTQVVIVQKNSLAFVCDSGSWRSGGGAQAGWTSDSIIGSDLGQAAASFLAAPANPTATATQSQFVSSLNSYMSAYSAYAQSGFSNQTLSNSVIVARATMQATLDALIH
jgi:prepilin-type N-terminal cleavage/methylation domain-containing protein